MRHLLYISALAVLLCAACSPSYDDMRRQLDQLAADNRADSLLTDDTLAITLAKYFDRHGTANERMMAHYLLGRTYYDRGELPAALEAYQNAADCADTASTACDHHTLSRIHAQMADMLIRQDAPHNALLEYEQARKYAWMAKDTLVALVCYEHLASVYSALNLLDTAVSIREEVSDMYARNNLPTYAAQSLIPAITILVDAEKYPKAKVLLDRFETVYGNEDSQQNRQRAYKTYYYVKGKYCLYAGKPDSAEYFFRKEIQLATKQNDLELGYKGLYSLYQSKFQADSMAKYAMLAYETNDSSYRELSTSHFQQMHALYDYRRHQQLAEKKTIEARNAKSLLALVTILLIVLLLAGYAVFISMKRRQERQAAKQQVLQDKYQQLKKEKTELQGLLKARDGVMTEITEEMNNLVAEKEQLINNLEKQIDQYAEREKLKKQSLRENAIINSAIVNRFSTSLVIPNTMITREEWGELFSLVQSNLPSFFPAIRNRYPAIREEELRVCTLIRCHFTMKDIASLMGISKQNLYAMRVRLMSKIFHQTGSAKQFDAMILRLE